MFRNILVPVDFTERSAAAVDAAAGLVDGDAGEVTLIHVVQTVPGLDLDGDPDFYERLETAASEKIEELGQKLRDRQVNWRALLVDMLGEDRLRRQGIFRPEPVLALRDLILGNPEARGLDLSAYQLRHQLWALRDDSVYSAA